MHNLSLLSLSIQRAKMNTNQLNQPTKWTQTNWTNQPNEHKPTEVLTDGINVQEIVKQFSVKAQRISIFAHYVKSN